MKKMYVTPSVKVYEVDVESSILAGSIEMNIYTDTYVDSSDDNVQMGRDNGNSGAWDAEW